MIKITFKNIKIRHSLIISECFLNFARFFTSRLYSSLPTFQTINYTVWKVGNNAYVHVPKGSCVANSQKLQSRKYRKKFSKPYSAIIFKVFVVIICCLCFVNEETFKSSYITSIQFEVSKPWLTRLTYNFHIN